MIQAVALRRRSGRGRQTARATGRRGSAAGGSMTSTVVDDHAEPVAEVGQRADDRRPGMRVEDEPDRIGLAADRQRVDLEARPAAGDRLAHLEHVRPEDEVVAALVEVVGVVLHERHAARQAVGHDLHRPDHGGGLPVALRTEAVAVAHQPLDGEAGQLGQPVQVLEGVGEGDEPAVGQERAQPELDARTVPQRVGAVAAGTERGDDVVLVEVGRDERVDLSVAGVVDGADEVADAIPVGREAQPADGLDLVAVGHRDVAHVLAEPGDAAAVPIVPCPRRPRPGPDPVLDLGVRPVAGDDRPLQPQPGGHEPELPVAVGGLVEVHEVHVDRRPRDVAMVLGMEVEERLVQALQPGDPHLGRGERVHPHDQPDTGRDRGRRPGTAPGCPRHRSGPA